MSQECVLNSTQGKSVTSYHKCVGMPMRFARYMIQVGAFLSLLQFPPPIKLIAAIQL